MTAQSSAARKDTAFLGHPVGLGWLAATEFWERFSYYGMLTLLVLYMTHRLLQPGHVEHVSASSCFGRQSNTSRVLCRRRPSAPRIYGLYAGPSI